MSSTVRICLYDPSGPGDGSFRVPFLELSDAVVVDECQAWQPLQVHLRAGQINIVAVNLDASASGGDTGLQVVHQITEVSPECGIIGVSADAQPEKIIAAMRAGCGQFVRWPIDMEDLREAVGRLRQAAAHSPAECQRVCLIGSSGGAGATTIACNLAIELAHLTERRCALVDMNFEFGDVACAFDVSAKHSVVDVCGAGVELDRTLIEMALEELPCKVSILARPEQMEQAHEISAEGVREMFRSLEQMFPYVVVDLPRYLGMATMATLADTDRVCIVTQLAIPFLRNALRMYEYLLRMGANEEQIEIVLNRYKASHERIKPQEVERQFGREIFGMIPNDYKHIGASRDLGHPLMADAPNSPARLAIREIARKLTSSHGDSAVQQRNSGRLLGFLRRPQAAQAER